MNRLFKYEFETMDGHYETFTVTERSESIANVEAKMYVERHANPATLTKFNLVCTGAA